MADKKGFTHNLPDTIDIQVPTIDGKQLKPVQWYAFQFFCQSTTAKEVLAKLHDAGFKVSFSALTKWQASQWWKDLRDYHIELLQDNFYIKLFEDLPKLHTALVEIWTKKWPEEDKNANAVVSSFREIVRLGKGKVVPLSQLRSEIDINVHTEETININIIKDILPLLNPDETNEFARTGEVPQHLVNQKLVELKSQDDDDEYS